MSRPSSQSGINRTKLMRLFGSKSNSPVKAQMNHEVFQTIDQFINEIKGDDQLFKMLKISSRGPSRKGSAPNSVIESAPNTPGLTPRKRSSQHARSCSETPISNQIKSVKTPQVIPRKRKAVSISIPTNKPSTANPFACDPRDENLLFGYIPPNPNSEILHDQTRQPGIVNAVNCRQAWSKTLNRIDEAKYAERMKRVPKMKTELFLSPYDAYKINNLLKMSMSPIERKKGFKLGQSSSSKMFKKDPYRTEKENL